MKITNSLYVRNLPGSGWRVTSWSTLRSAAIGSLILLTLAACATTSTAARDKQIQQRAQARWDALLAGDYAAAYAYASPGYRSANSVTDFEIGMRARRVQYVSAEYKEHSCEEDICNVTVQVDYRIVRPLAGLPEWNSSSPVGEQWIQLDGAWWFLPES